MIVSVLKNVSSSSSTLPFLLPQPLRDVGPLEFRDFVYALTPIGGGEIVQEKQTGGDLKNFFPIEAFTANAV